MRRASFKLWFFGVASFAQSVMGHGFVKPLTALALMSGIIAIAIGRWNGERITAPHFTSFDEAAWFLIVGCVLHHYR